MRYCDLAVSKGLLAVRSHVDVSDPRLVTVEALLEVRDRVAPYLDLQLVAFPQDGYYRAPGVEDALTRALDMGVEVVGGIPHFERTMEEGTRSVEALCRIAADRGLRVDMHCDETDDPMSRHVETLAAQDRALRAAGQGRRVAPDLDAFDGQLLCLEAAPPDGGGRDGRHPQPADQHDAAGAARHLSQTPRADADSAVDGGGDHRGRWGRIA